MHIRSFICKSVNGYIRYFCGSQFRICHIFKFSCDRFTKSPDFHPSLSGKNTSDCLFQSPFSFLFCAKIAKIISTKNPLVTVMKKHIFSPIEETLIFQTFRQSYLIEFFQVCDRNDRMRQMQRRMQYCSTLSWYKWRVRLGLE